MSKSDENPNASIYLMDDPDTIMRKFKRAVTDSEAQVRYRDEQPGIKNLIDIYCACTGKTPEEVLSEAIKLIDTAETVSKYDYEMPPKEWFYSWVFANGLR